MKYIKIKSATYGELLAKKLSTILKKSLYSKGEEFIFKKNGGYLDKQKEIIKKKAAALGFKRSNLESNMSQAETARNSDIWINNEGDTLEFKSYYGSLPRENRHSIILKINSNKITSESKISDIKEGSYISLGKDTKSKSGLPLYKGTVCKITKITKTQVFCQSPDDEVVVFLKDKFPFKVIK